MASRKHRIVIEVTFYKALTDGKAVKGLRLALENTGFRYIPIWANASEVYIEKVETKSFSRVVRGLLAAAKKHVENLCS